MVCGIKGQFLQIQKDFSDCFTYKNKVDACLLSSWKILAYQPVVWKEYEGIPILKKIQIQNNHTENSAGLGHVFVTVKSGIDILR